ncbi:TPA: conjugal transfer protein TraO [Salmonella enterica subsp. salamae serovar 35:g,m,s,t:-]|nr:conjugal transfer protein TraO [Salmonella enterica subsp. salamae serovar 35:g,m,s,t:-]HCA3549726.1 conjugal transfer protein TraO [Salmonella enterica subsp. salamae serovar 35:g,m,s,t:-]
MAEKNDFIRNRNVLIAVGAGLSVIAAFIIYTYVKTPDSNNESHLTAINSTGQKTNTTESAHYADELNTMNNTNASKAAKNNESYLSVLDNQQEQITVSTGSNSSHSAPPIIENKVPTTSNSIHDNRQSNDMQKRVEMQTAALLASWTPGPPVDATIKKSSNDYVASIIPVSYSTNSQISTVSVGSNAISQTSPTKLNKKVVEDYSLVAGELETDLDSDENSVVWATIQSGKWEGAKVYADGYKLLTSTIDMTFTRMAWNNHTYIIKAKPMDSATGRTSLSGDVEHHWFSRIVVPSIAEALAKGGQVYEDSYGTTTVSDGVVVQDNEKPDTDEIVGAAIGGFGDAASSVLKSDAARVSSREVTIPKGTTIGIQFLGAVYENDDADLKKETALVPQTQPASQELINQQQSAPSNQQFSSPAAPHHSGTVTYPTY